MLAFAEQEALNDDQQEELNPMQDTITMDSVSGIEKMKLIKELGGIHTTLQSITSGIEKLNLVKRIKGIRGCRRKLSLLSS